MKTFDKLQLGSCCIFCRLLDLLLSKLEVSFKTLGKKFIVYSAYFLVVRVYFLILQLFRAHLMITDNTI